MPILKQIVVLIYDSRFSLDVTATISFGLDVNTVENPNDPFGEMEKLVNNGKIMNRIRLIGLFFCPKYVEKYVQFQ